MARGQRRQYPQATFRVKQVIESVLDGDTQEAARIMDVNQSTISRYMNHQITPSRKALFKLNQRTGVAFAWLRGLIDDPGICLVAPPKQQIPNGGIMITANEARGRSLEFLTTQANAYQEKLHTQAELYRKTAWEVINSMIDLASSRGDYYVVYDLSKISDHELMKVVQRLITEGLEELGYVVNPQVTDDGGIELRVGWVQPFHRALVKG